MRELLLLSIIFTFFLEISAQEKSKLISGKVVLDNNSIPNVHVINKNTNLGTISNANGVFEIPVNLGDSLFFLT